MKKNYNFSKQRSGLISLILIAMFGLMSTNAWGQSFLNWTGATDTDATNPANWDPAESPLNNDITIDSAYKFTNLPVLSLTGDNAINMIHCNNTGVFTVADAGNFLDINSSGSMYFHGELVLQAGTMSVRKNVYLEDSITKIRIEGGTFEVRSTLAMAHGNDYPTGGRIEISNEGHLHLRGFPIRFATDSLESIMQITDNGYVTIAGADHTASADFYIARNQIISDDMYDPYSYYNVDEVTTYIDLRPKDNLYLKSTATIQVFTGELVPTIFAANNRGFETLVSKEWKYATTSGGPYVSFDPVQSADSLYNLTFATAGSYFVVLEGSDGTTTKTSDEIQVAVSDPMIDLTPAGEQTIRVGFTGGTITATYMQTPTSVEWKYTTTSGGPYTAFDPAVTVDEYVPSFDAEGNYYVVCEAIVDGTTYTSKEISIKMVARDAAAQNITWTGAYSNDAADLRNYEPMMHPWFNNVTIPTREWTDNPPTLTTSGNDTINKLQCNDSAQFVINKPALDTLVIRGSSVWQAGYIVVESGIVVYTSGYVRLDTKTSGIVLKNNGQFLHHDYVNGFIIGHGEAVDPGGEILIQDDAYMSVHHFWRWAADSTQSVITIRDNGLLELVGDQISDVAYRVQRRQIKSIEGFVADYRLKVVDQDTTTIVTAKAEVAFDIANLDEQFVGIDLPMDELTTINDDVITSREWKYTTTSGEGYVSFDPAQTGATLAASFSTAGTYYIICEGTDGTETYMTDEAVVTVVSVDIAPADVQEIIVFEEGTLLTVTESVVPDSREWKFTSTPGTGYTSFSPARLSDTYRPFFTEVGTYYIICESVYGGKGIVSNEVEVSIINDTVSIEEFRLPVDIYPNPSEGAFYLNVGTGNSYDVAVYDITGKTVREYINVAGRQQIVIEKEGLYLLKVTQGEATVTRKVIIR